MAYTKLSLDNYKEEALRIERLKRFGNPFEFANGISLAAFEAANEEVKRTTEAKNAHLEILDGLTETCQAAVEKRTKLIASLRGCIASTLGRECDEFVTAGGIRQSEVIEKQMQAREAKKKAAELKDPQKE